jgi:hypothetical protein
MLWPCYVFACPFSLFSLHLDQANSHLSEKRGANDPRPLFYRIRFQFLTEEDRDACAALVGAIDNGEAMRAPTPGESSYGFAFRFCCPDVDPQLLKHDLFLYFRFHDDVPADVRREWLTWQTEMQNAGRLVDDVPPVFII